jgi:outer membrane receptor for ferrienterochelin and colicins
VHEADRWLAAIYGEVEWGITDDFALTTGLRYNDDEFFGAHLSPRVYGVYSLTPTLTFKGGVSTGYKQPTLTQATEGFGGRTGGGGSPNVGSNGQPLPRALSIGNPDLEPETSTSYEIGFVFDDPSIGLGTSVMLFHTVYKDKIAEDRFCTSPNAANNNDVANYACNFGGNNFYFLSTTRNIDKAVIQGLEFTLDYAITDDLSWMSSYTFTDSEQKSGEFTGEPLNKQPRHMFNTNLDWQVTDKLNLWSQYNYRSRTSDYLSRTSMSEGTPGYGFVDIGAVYGLSRNVDLTAGLYNVANKEIANDDYEVVLDGRRLVVGVTVDF